MIVPTPAPVGHVAVAEAALPRLFAAELVEGLGVVVDTTVTVVDLDTPERTRAAAAQARQFADHLDALADEQQAADDVDKAITALEAHLDTLRAMRRQMGAG